MGSGYPGMVTAMHRAPNELARHVDPGRGYGITMKTTSGPRHAHRWRLGGGDEWQDQ